MRSARLVFRLQKNRFAPLFPYRRCGVQIVNLYYGLCTQERIALLRENGILASVWTVNDVSCARQFLDAGVYNITTRQPVMVCGLRKETGV